MKSLHIFPGCHRLHYTKLDVGSKRDFPLKTVANRNDWQILMWTPQFRRHDWTARLVEEFGWKSGAAALLPKFCQISSKIYEAIFSCWRVLKHEVQKLDVCSKCDFLLKLWLIGMIDKSGCEHLNSADMTEQQRVEEFGWKSGAAAL